MQRQLKYLFEARSICVVGATTNEGKLGYQVLKNIIEGGFSGEIYAINQKGGTVMGLPCYASLSELPKTPELIVVLVPSRFAVGIIDEAGRMGTKAAIVITGGFGETGHEELESELFNTARKYGMLLQGPNCQGLIYNPNHMCASWPLVDKTGPIAMIAQSGSVGAEVGIRAQNEGLGVSAIVSLGNKSDLNETDFIEYFGTDPNTAAIGLYLEGVSDGARFISTVKNVTKRKPVVVLKSGRSDEGKRAVASHTKSLAGSSQVFDGLCKQYGILNAKNVTELYELLKGASLVKVPKGDRVMIVTSSGGTGALASDLISDAGLKLNQLRSDVKALVAASLPAHCVVKNPVDLTGDATAALYSDIIEKVALDDGIDTIMVIFGDPFPGVGDMMAYLHPRVKQSLVACYIGGGDVQKVETEKMNRAGVAAFSSPETCVDVIRALADYGAYLSSISDAEVK